MGFQNPVISPCNSLIGVFVCRIFLQIKLQIPNHMSYAPEFVVKFFRAWFMHDPTFMDELSQASIFECARHLKDQAALALPWPFSSP